MLTAVFRLKDGIVLTRQVRFCDVFLAQVSSCDYRMKPCHDFCKYHAHVLSYKKTTLEFGVKRCSRYHRLDSYCSLPRSSSKVYTCGKWRTQERIVFGGAHIKKNKEITSAEGANEKIYRFCSLRTIKVRKVTFWDAEFARKNWALCVTFFVKQKSIDSSHPLSPSPFENVTLCNAEIRPLPTPLPFEKCYAYYIK